MGGIEPLVESAVRVRVPVAFDQGVHVAGAPDVL